MQSFPFRFVFIAIFVIAIGMFVAQLGSGAKMYSSSEKMYAIDVPAYDGTVTTHFTNEYRINAQTGCVTFVDQWRFEQILCNNFNIKRLK